MGKRMMYNNSLNPELIKDIKILAAQLEKRQKDLLEETIYDLLDKYKHQYEEGLYWVCLMVERLIKSYPLFFSKANRLISDNSIERRCVFIKQHALWATLVGCPNLFALILVCLLKFITSHMLGGNQMDNREKDLIQYKKRFLILKRSQLLHPPIQSFLSDTYT